MYVSNLTRYTVLRSQFVALICVATVTQCSIVQTEDQMHVNLCVISKPRTALDMNLVSWFWSIESHTVKLGVSAYYSSLTVFVVTYPVYMSKGVLYNWETTI